MGGVERGTWTTALAGFAAIALALGLCRFAYGPLVPLLVDAHWVSAPEAGWAGAANFLGYLLGVLVIVRVARRVDRRTLLLASLGVATVSLAAPAWNFGFAWLACWRALQGLSAATLMTFIPGAVMASVPENRRRLVGGITLSGSGFALVPSLALPQVEARGPAGAWILVAVLGALCAVVAGPFVWTGVKGREAPRGQRVSLSAEAHRSFVLFGASYLLLGVAIVPDAIFLSDYLHECLHADCDVAGKFFSLFALGCALGGVTGGALAYRFGTRRSLLVIGAVALVGNLLALFTDSVAWVALSSLLIAAWCLGTTAIATIRVLELAGAAAHAKYWALLCAAIAVGQSVGSAVFAALLHQGIPYPVLFWSVEVLVLAMLVLIVLSYRVDTSYRPGAVVPLAKP